MSTLIVFGYGPVLAGRNGLCGTLNIFGKLNAIAEAHLCLLHRPEIVIATGGKTGDQDKCSEALLLKKMILARAGSWKPKFILDEEVDDTIYNLVNVANILDDFLFQRNNTGFIAMGFHILRIRKICSILKLDREFFCGGKSSR